MLSNDKKKLISYHIARMKMYILRLLRVDIQTRYRRYKIGRGSYGNPKIHNWGEDATCQIGSFCSIASGVQIFLGGEHITEMVTTYPFNIFWKSGINIKAHPKTKGDVIIGNDVWVGSDVIIMSGVKIGDGAVVGAGSVVTKDIPPYAIAAGNPAIVIRKRFSDDHIRSLLAIKWWDWDDEKIERHLPLLLNKNIDKFIDSIS